MSNLIHAYQCQECDAISTQTAGVRLYECNECGLKFSKNQGNGAGHVCPNCTNKMGSRIADDCCVACETGEVDKIWYCTECKVGVPIDVLHVCPPPPPMPLAKQLCHETRVEFLSPRMFLAMCACEWQAEETTMGKDGSERYAKQHLIQVEAGHAVRIRLVPNGWAQALCSCGWKDVLRFSKSQANTAVREHLREQIGAYGVLP